MARANGAFDSRPFSIVLVVWSVAVRERTNDRGYRTRHAANDLKKFLAKGNVTREGKPYHYTLAPDWLKAISALGAESST